MKSYILHSLAISIIVTLATSKVFGQGCPNANFSANNFSNWSGFTGSYNNPGQTPGIVTAQHTIMNAPAIDGNTCGGLNVLPPGATQSARLGNQNTGAQGERLRYSMTVDASNALFVYKYAVVLENPSGHAANEQPEFSMRILNQAGVQIGGNCGIYTVYGGQPGQNFQNCGGVTWLPWTTVGVNLQPFIGQTIQVEFTTKDCSLSGHFGYAYIAAECMPLTIDVAYCEGANVVTMTAPPGFQSYQWSNGATTQSVTINNPTFGQSFSCTLQTFSNQGNCTVTVNTQVFPTIIDPGFTWVPVCEDATMTFNDTTVVSNPNNPITSWNWNFGDGGTSGLENPTHIYTNPGQYYVNLYVYTDDGCVDSVSQLVTVWPKSIPTFTYQDVCIGEESVFTNTSTDSLTMNYTWNLNNGFPMQNVEDISYTYPNAGTYNVTLYITNSLGCSSFAIQPVTIHPLPNIDAGPDFQVCPNTSVTLSGSGAQTYVWDNNVVDGVPFVVTSSQIYHVTGTDAVGCEATDSVTVTFFPTPNVQAGPDQEVCEGASVTFSGSGANSYTWNNNVIDGQAFIPVVDTFELVVTGTGANNCQQTDTALLIVHPTPVVLAGPDQLICNGSQTTISGSGADTYVWDNGVSNGVPFIPLASTTYTVTGTTNLGCFDTDQVVVNLEAPAIPAINSPITSGCAPVAVSLSNISSGTPSVNCTWNLGDNTVLDTCGAVDNVYTEPGCYDITLTLETALGCVWEETFDNYICVFANPIAAFTPTPGTLSELDPETTMNNSSTGAVTYEWDLGDGTFSDEEEPIHIYPVVPVQNYTVELIATSDYGCTDTATAIIVINEELIYYIPNTFTPDGDEFNNTFQPIFTSGFDPFDFNMVLFNRWGEVVFETNDAKVGWDGTYHGESVKEGTYNWKIEFKKSTSDERVTIVGHVTILR